MASMETPMGLALVLCDQIIEDKLSGKKTLVGLFDRIQTPVLPCVHPALSIFVSITGGRGEYHCEIVCRHTDNETLAFSAKGKVMLRDPRQVVDMVFRLQGARFVKPDMYWLHFLVDGVPIMMRPIFVRLQQKKKEQDRKTEQN